MAASAYTGLPVQSETKWKSAWKKLLGKGAGIGVIGGSSQKKEQDSQIVILSDDQSLCRQGSGSVGTSLKKQAAIGPCKVGEELKTDDVINVDTDYSSTSLFDGVAHVLLYDICEHLNDVDCMRLRFVSKEFRRLLDEGDWFWRHLAFRNLQPGNHLSSEATAAEDCVEKFAERNLIHNPSGEEGLRGWRITTRKYAIMRNKQVRAAYRWTIGKVETTAGPATCFMASHCSCLKWQRINLVERGFDGSFLDDYQPPITISDSCSTRWDANSLYSLTVMLLDHNFRVVAHYTSGDVVCPCANAPGKPFPFKKIEFTFRGYGKGVRFVYFEHSGMEDMDLWRSNAGHYGAYMKGASVRILTSQSEKRKEAFKHPLRDSWRPQVSP